MGASQLLPISLGVHLHRDVESAESNRQQQKDFLEPVISRPTAITSAEQPAYLMAPMQLRPEIPHSDAASPYTSLPKERIGPIFVWLTCKERVRPPQWSALVLRRPAQPVQA